MPEKKTNPDIEKFIAEARHDQNLREQTYRERALKIYPTICARCGREFSGKKLRELTVHHKDHNHNNNPPDGSNWELLCIYCHDNEHSRYIEEAARDGGTPQSTDQEPSSTFKPFADLKSLLKNKE